MQASTEEWRPVLEYEGLYEVSDQGRVRSIDRTVIWIRDGMACSTSFPGRMLAIRLSRRRPQTRLSKDGKPLTVNVHRLVLEAFVGPRPEGLECCHEDGERTNNYLANLRWDTRASNDADKRRHGTMPCGERSGTAKLTKQDVREIRRRYAEGQTTYGTIARDFGVAATTIGAIVRRVTWFG